MTVLNRMRRDIRSRKRERGAAVFVVVLVITLLTGLGVYAVRSAGIANAASGYNRQMTQVHFVSDFAIQSAVAVIAGNPEAAKTMMMRGPDLTGINPDGKCVAWDDLEDPTCYRLSYDDINLAVQTAYSPTNPSSSTARLIHPFAADAPGSLGRTNVEADMSIEVTDLHPALPVKGMEAAGGADSNVQLKYVYVTVSASGLVRPQQASGGTWDKISGTSAGSELARAHVYMGPVQMQR
jgi:hypothetical protein